jgi:hypothetical protein
VAGVGTGMGAVGAAVGSFAVGALVGDGVAAQGTNSLQRITCSRLGHR